LRKKEGESIQVFPLMFFDLAWTDPDQLISR